MTIRQNRYNAVSYTHLDVYKRQALERIDLSDTLPDALLNKLDLPGFEKSIRYLHNPPANADENALLDRTHPAWERMKFDELLAQQLSMRRAQIARDVYKRQ